MERRFVSKYPEKMKVEGIEKRIVSKYPEKMKVEGI